MNPLTIALPTPDANMLLYGCGVSAFSVGQLTVGWREGKARERGMCESISSRAFSSVGLLLPMDICLRSLPFFALKVFVFKPCGLGFFTLI